MLLFVQNKGLLAIRKELNLCKYSPCTGFDALKHLSPFETRAYRGVDFVVVA